MHKKRNRVKLQFCFHTVFRKCELDITNISGGSFLENEKENRFL